MCGITGIVDLKGLRAIDRDQLTRMNESQHHRGPDGGGLHVEPGVGLGHRRLSIIDVATGQQPLYNEDGSVVVVYNGEIYNYQALIPELLALGHVFRTKSDTEVIVHAWEAWGERCVERFRGMFAFALWDRNRQTLFLARDRLGVKPLHYAILPDGTLLFGSELKSLLAHGALDRAIDPLAIEEYFALGYVAEPRTIFAAAKKLAPAHTLTLRRGAPLAEPRCYWDPRFTLASTISQVEAAEELVARLDESVKLRLISEVPLGAFLSGGVDSSAVVASMARVSGEPVNTCSIAFADPAFDESRYAAMIAERYGTRHFVDRVESDDFDLIDTLAGIYDEPYADSSAIPTYRVCQLARKHVTVALSGDGGDETFAGYRRYRMHLNEERMRRALPQALRGPLFGALGRAYPEGRLGPALPAGEVDVPGARSRRRGRVFQRRVHPARRHAQQAVQRAVSRLARGLRRERGVPAARVRWPTPTIRWRWCSTSTSRPISSATSTRKSIAPSMAHSLEVREPLMDHPLVEWLGTLPSSLKVRDGEGKWLLKKAMEPRLPDDVLYRPKMGFAVPLARWFRGPLRDRVRVAMTGERLAATGIFEPAYLRRLCDDHQSGVRDYSAPLWTLLMFDAFLRNVVDAGSTRPSLERAA